MNQFLRIVALVTVSVVFYLEQTMLLAIAIGFPNDPVSAAPTLRPTFASNPYDPNVGTALAPTTTGGACLNDHDYEMWITVDPETKMNGYEMFPFDMEKCAERCSNYLGPLQSVEYNCGGFSGTVCPENLYAICVQDCMARQPVLTERPEFPELMSPEPYTLECASCMGNISYCATQNCFGSCALGRRNPSCQYCNELYCNRDFEICAGLNVDQKQPTPFDFTVVIIGAVSGGLGLLLSVGVFGYRYRLKTRKHRELSPDELAKLANMQENIVGFRSSLESQTSRIQPGKAVQLAANQAEDAGSAAAKHKSRPKTKPHKEIPLVPTQNVILTPYQREFEAQQRANAANIERVRPPPSARMSLLVTGSSTELANKAGTPLIMIWTFEGEQPDELTLKNGTKIVGLEQADGWWVAQTKDGQVGLVPVSYTAHDIPSSKSNAYPTRTVPPSARMSKFHTSVVASPSQRILEMPVTPLLVVYDFDGESEDELTVKTGSVVLGIHEEDGWYLVRTETGDKLGLVPSNYLEKIMASPTVLPTYRPPIHGDVHHEQNNPPPQPETKPSNPSKWLFDEPDF